MSAEAKTITLALMREQQDVLIGILAAGTAPLDIELLEGLQDAGVLDDSFRPTPLGVEVGELMATGYGR